jgi:hypothetical protein
MGARGTAAGRSAADERRLTRPREARGRRGAGGLPRDAQLGVDVGQVALDGPDAQVQAPRYLLVADPRRRGAPVPQARGRSAPRARPAALRRHWVEGVAAGHTVIRYDARGWASPTARTCRARRVGWRSRSRHRRRRARPRRAARDVAGRAAHGLCQSNSRCVSHVGVLASGGPLPWIAYATRAPSGAVQNRTSSVTGTTSPATRDVSIRRQRRPPRASETEASEFTINPAGSPTT